MADFSNHFLAPRFDGQSGVFLAKDILEHAPDDPSERLHRRLVTVRETGEGLRAIVKRRQAESSADLGVFNATFGSAWLGVREAIEAKARIVGSEVGDRARLLLSRVFPDGTRFLKLAGRREWAESDVLLERLDEEGLAAQIDALIGPEQLAFVRRAHEAYGEALGLGRDVESQAESTALRDAIDALASAISDYGRILVGEVEPDDEASVARFRRAVAPIEAQREANRRAASDPAPPPPSPDVDLDQPIPPVAPVDPAEA